MFEFSVRVYYEDTDTGGIVFYANYLKFFERARTEWLRAGGNGHPGVSQQRIADELGLMFVVRSTRVDYRRPARLDDTIRIVSTIARLGRVGIDFHQEAFVTPPDGSPAQLVATGRIQVACVARATLKPSQVPESVRAIFVPGAGST
jgi:acyl-CoA thioester hydrolase